MVKEQRDYDAEIEHTRQQIRDLQRHLGGLIRDQRDARQLAALRMQQPELFDAKGEFKP